METENDLIKAVFPVEEKLTYIDGDLITFITDDDDYSESFGLQWNQFLKTQLDSYTQTSISEDRLKRIFGNLGDMKGKLILELGCGSGRFTEVLLKFGARVVSVDMSSAVYANKKNFPVNDSHIIVRADMNNLPFKRNVFDIIVCLGVLQHTPDTFKSIDNSVLFLREGGIYSFDHYKHTLSVYTKSTFIFRFFLSFYNSETKYKRVRQLFKRLYPLHVAVKRYPVFQKLLSRFSPVHAYFIAYPQLKRRHQLLWSWLDTHDSLTDPFKRHLSLKKVRKHLNSRNYKTEYLAQAGNGIECRFKKP